MKQNLYITPAEFHSIRKLIQSIESQIFPSIFWSSQDEKRFAEGLNEILGVNYFDGITLQDINLVIQNRIAERFRPYDEPEPFELFKLHARRTLYFWMIGENKPLVKVPARRHRRRRIQKKWIKRFGYKFRSQKQFDRIKVESIGEAERRMKPSWIAPPKFEAEYIARVESAVTPRVNAMMIDAGYERNLAPSVRAANDIYNSSLRYTFPVVRSVIPMSEEFWRDYFKSEQLRGRLIDEFLRRTRDIVNEQTVIERF